MEEEKAFVDIQITICDGVQSSCTYFIKVYICDFFIMLLFIFIILKLEMVEEV